MDKFNNVNDCLQKWLDLKKNETAIIAYEKDSFKQVSFQKLGVLIENYSNYFYAQGLKKDDLVVTN